MSLLSRLRHRAQHAETRDKRAYWLRAYLRAKARRGQWDNRMLNGYSANVTWPVKRFIMRAVASGLVCTSTYRGRGGTSFHDRSPAGAADVGHRKPGTKAAYKAEVKFQRREFLRGGYYELIGPDNSWNILRGHRTGLLEGTTLETQHDNHVHGAPIQ